jgi:CHAT domain-containing protein
VRALLFILLLLSVCLTGCNRPAASDYWSPPGTSDAAAQTSGGETETYDRLMADGTRANLAGRTADATALFRRALRAAQSRYGTGKPDTALPIMSLALSLSVDRQFTEADARFAEAERVLRGSKDNAMKARMLHYRGIHLLDEGKPSEAEALLRSAQAAYTALLPDDALTREPAARLPPSGFDINSGGRIAQAIRPQADANDSISQANLLGLIEVMRYRSIALRQLGRLDDAAALTSSATKIAAANGLARASVYARLYRTAGITAAAERASGGNALESLRRSDDAFRQVLPGTLPAAETQLLRAGELVRSGTVAAAVPLCRSAVATLMAIASGTSPELMAPCLQAYATTGGTGSDAAAHRAEMFLAAQVAQSSLTSHQIAQASAALAENARNPEVGAALKLRDSLQRDLARIYRALDTLGSEESPSLAGEQIGQLQQQADKTQAALVKAEATVRELSPNYGQLVQDVVPARAVFAAMHRDEAFIAFFLSEHDGWTFALRDGEIAVAPIEGGLGVIGPLVQKVRAGAEEQSGAFDIDDTRRLYDLTVGKVSERLKGSTALIIAPTGPLLSVPFAMLLTGPADATKLAEAPWLLRQATVTHVPAPTNFVSLRKIANTSKAQEKWFGFGDFRKAAAATVQADFPGPQCARDRVELANMPLLPGATRELKETQAVLGAPPTDMLLGSAFTADRVMKLDLKNYQILHFAAHALLPTDLDCQTEAAIVTSPPPGGGGKDSWLLTASRLLGLDLDADLVILSACNSGGGDGRSGESLSGLARSFFFARARSLMVTHWDVNDQAAALLVVLTINNMREKPELGVSGALREAQLMLLDRAAAGKLPANIAMPFFWAPFAVIGEGGSKDGRSALSFSLQRAKLSSRD